MNPTTSLDFSRKLFEIIGEQKTDSKVINIYSDKIDDSFPAYTFGELLRVIPLIAYEKSLALGAMNIKETATMLIEVSAKKYSRAPTPEQGMREVEAYLKTMI